MFETCKRFGWFLGSVEERLGIVVTDVETGVIVARAAAADEAAAADTDDTGRVVAVGEVPIMLASRACWAAATAATAAEAGDSVSDCCNRSG